MLSAWDAPADIQTASWDRSDPFLLMGFAQGGGREGGTVRELEELWAPLVFDRIRVASFSYMAK